MPLIWSRTKDQVRFSPEAIEEIERQANVLEEKFGNNRVPLVSKDVDKKLAKLAAANAALRVNYDTEWNLVIERDDVLHVTQLIDRVYSGEGMRLDQFTGVVAKRTELTEAEYHVIKTDVEVLEDKEKIPAFGTIVDELLVRGSAQRSELIAFFDEQGQDISRKVVDDRVSVLKKHKLIFSGPQGYRLTPKGVASAHKYLGSRIPLEKTEASQ